MTQCEKVLKYIDEHGSISNYEALTRCRIGRLASRVNDLRKDGVNIKTTMVTFTDEFGEKSRYARYSRG